MLYDDMMALDMRLGFKVNGSFGSLANFENSDISDMKPSTVIIITILIIIIMQTSFHKLK